MSTIAFFIIPLISAVPGILIVVVAVLRSKKRKRVYAALRREYGGEANEVLLLDVKYASKKRFERYLKFFPWEMAGILVVRERVIETHLVSTNGKRRISLSFDADRHSIEWKKPDLLRNGVISWLAINGPDGEKHYFTGETGATIFGSRRRNTELIERIQTALHLSRCRQCEYLLWGNTTGICPECGTVFTRPESDAAPTR